MTSLARLSHSQRARHWALVVVGVLLLLGVAPYAYSGAVGSFAGGGVSDGRTAPHEPFHISGSVASAIYIGQLVPINVSFTNPNGVLVTVRHLQVRTMAISAPNATKVLPCTLGDFRVRQPNQGLSVTLPRWGGTSLAAAGVPKWMWPAIRLVDRPTNQDGCRGATVTLSYHGTGGPGRTGGSS